MTIKDALAESQNVIVICISKPLSKSYEAALLAKSMLNDEEFRRVEIVNSNAVVMGEGFLTMIAARMARQGNSIDEIITMMNDLIPKIRILGILGTVKHLLAGGRLNIRDGSLASKLIKKAESATGFRLVVTLKDGLIVPILPPVNIDNMEKKLIDFARSFPRATFIAVEYTIREDEERANRIASEINKFFPAGGLYISRIGAALGVHGGPGTLIVSVLEDIPVFVESKTPNFALTYT